MVVHLAERAKHSLQRAIVHVVVSLLKHLQQVVHLARIYWLLHLRQLIWHRVNSHRGARRVRIGFEEAKRQFFGLG